MILNTEPIKPKKEKFFTKEVRVIYYQGKGYIVAQDFFNALNRLDNKGQIKSEDRRKIKRYLDRLKCDSVFFTITLKDKKSKAKARNTQEVWVIPIEHLAFLVIPFEPNKNNEELNDIYNEFIRWVDDLLIKNKAYEKLFNDKEMQKERHNMITEQTDEKVVIVNNSICRLLAEILGIEGKVTKEMIKELQPNYIIDLLELRQEIFDVFLQQLIMEHTKTESYNDTLRYIKKKYGEIKENN